jgi:hypothetical protein
MRTRIATLTLAAGCLLAAMSSANAYVVGSAVIPGDSDSVSVRDCSVETTQIRCNVVNRSNAELRDVQVAVKHEYRWRNEFHPGDDNPGWSAVLALHDPIPPGGSVSFTYPGRFDETRRDGDFQTSVEVLGYTEISYPDGRPRS